MVLPVVKVIHVLLVCVLHDLIFSDVYKISTKPLHS